MRKLYSVFFLLGILMSQQLAAHPIRDTLPSDSLRPDITGFTPAAAPQNATVLIIGKHFTGAANVRFGGVNATAFSVVNDTLIRAVVGAGASGAVWVSTLFGTDTLGGFTFLSSPPRIRAFRPASGRTGDTIRIIGNNLSRAASVSFGGVRASALRVVSDTLLLAIVGNGASGVVRVTTPGGADTACCFRYIGDTLRRPVITRFTPTAGSTNTRVRIFGRNFFNTTSVSFGGVPAQSYSVVGDTLINAFVGNGASGIVQVTTTGGSDTACCFTYVGDTLPPVITRFTPTTGSTGTAVSIFGRNFVNTTNVRFGGVPALSYTVSGDTLINAFVGNGASGILQVTTLTGSDTACCFTFIGDTTSGKPVITFFYPDTVRRGQLVDINGRNFTGTTSVRFGSTPAQSFQVITDTLIYAIVGNGSSGNVEVVNAAGADTACCIAYVNDSAGRPDIITFSPRAARQGQQVQIFGRNFIGTNWVSFGGVGVQSFQVISDTLIYARVGNGASGLVQVNTINGFDTACCFTYINDSTAPIISFFSPFSARKGNTVEISGRHFTNATAVTFGGIPAATYTVITDTLIYATVGNGASGLVRVANPYGFDTACCFTYITDTIPSDSTWPNITSFTPTSGTAGSKVWIFGSNLTGVTSVTFGRIPARSFSVLSDTVISAIVDTGRTGLVEVRKPFGRDSLGTFTYVPTDTLYTITVAPNPARNTTIVTHPAIGTASQLKLSDVSGHVIRTVSIAPRVTQTRLNLNGVRPGIYKIGWTNGRKWFSQTILIQ